MQPHSLIDPDNSFSVMGMYTLSRDGDNTMDVDQVEDDVNCIVL